MENIKQVLPKCQVQIIKDALVSYKKTIEVILSSCEKSGEGFPDSVNHTHFDLLSLITFMDYDVTINMPQSVKDNFGKYSNVDFPIYDDVDTKLKYPTSSKWVTVITGDLSYEYDAVEGSKCYVKELYSIEKYLREDLDNVIDDIKNSDYKYIIVEDYDGSIEMVHPTKEEKEEREFQVVWIATHYDADSQVHGINYFNNNGFQPNEIEVIDILNVGQYMKTDDAGVMVLRIK